MRQAPLFGAAVALLLLLGSSVAEAEHGKVREYEVTVTNLTKGQVFSPPLLVTHRRSIALFDLGAPASDPLAILAEDGDATPLAELLATLPAASFVETAPAGLPPGASATYVIQARPYRDVLSLASMLVNTNDAFVALDSERLPRRRGATRHYIAAAYDAGSEANNEDCAFVPGPACPADSGNARAVDGAEHFVHIHNGIHAIADLSASAYDWRNPVATISIRRTR